MSEETTLSTVIIFAIHKYKFWYGDKINEEALAYLIRAEVCQYIAIIMESSIESTDKVDDTLLLKIWDKIAK